MASSLVFLRSAMGISYCTLYLEERDVLKERVPERHIPANE